MTCYVSDAAAAAAAADDDDDDGDDDMMMMMCWCRWNEQLDDTERRALRVAMLCGAKGDVHDVHLWQQDVIVITAGILTPQHLKTSFIISELLCTTLYGHRLN